MGLINRGSQTLSIDYNQELSAELENHKLVDIVKPGISSGFTLTKVDNATVNISTGIMFIYDSVKSLAVKCETALAINDQTISETEPYIIARSTWTNADNSYIDFYNVAFGDILETDIIIGKGNFTGSTLNDFDYSERSILGAINNIIKKESSLLSDDETYEQGQIIIPSDEPILRKSDGETSYTDLPVYAGNQIIELVDSGVTLDRSSSENIIFVSAGGSDRTVTLPDATHTKNREYYICKSDAGVGVVIISTSGGTIGGAASQSLSSQNDSLTVISNGTNYLIKY